MTQRFNGGFIPRNQGDRMSTMSDEERQVRELFGPGSNSLKAAQVAKHQPELYAKLKQAACYDYNLVPEAMLPRASQLTSDQLEQKRRRDLAAQQNDLIEVPPQVCDRLGLQHGTRVTWEQWQKTMGRQPV